MSRRPNILLIVTDEERFTLPRPAGFSLPGRERIAGFKSAFAEADIDPAGALVCLQESSMDFAQGDALELLSAGIDGGNWTQRNMRLGLMR